MSDFPAIIAVSRVRGDNMGIALKLVHPDTGAAFNPTGYVLMLTVKRAAGDADSAAKIQKLSTVGGFAITSAATGDVSVSFVPADTATLAPGIAYVADVRAQDGATGARLTVWRGTMTFDFDVSRNATLSIPTVVVNPDAAYLSAQQIEANRAAVEASATAAAASADAAAVSATAADTARAAAVVAKTAAEVAQAAAETAEDGAVAAKSAADADVLATAADRAAVAADKVTVAADKATVAADKATVASDKAAAAASATAAGTSATNAAASATAAATSATSAATFATNAATSATQAANAVAAQFLGGVAGNAVPNTATAAGYYYRITSAGTSQSKTWAVGDLAIYNGTSGNWTQISGGVTDPASLANKTNTLAPRGGAAFDGTSSQRVTAAISGQSVGTDPFSIHTIVSVPTSNPSASYGWGFLCGNGPNDNVGQAGTFEWSLNTSGQLRIYTRGDSGGSLSAIAFVNNVVSRFAGEDIQLTIIRNSTGSPTVYINGEAQALTGEVSQGGRTWQSSITANYVQLGWHTTSSLQVGVTRSFTLYNLALSATDVQEIYELGGAVPERYKFGSQTELYGNPGFETAGAGGADVFASWGESTSGASTITRDTTDFQSGTASCKIFIDGSNSALEIGQPVVVAGKPHRLRFWAKADAAASDLIKVDAGAAALILGSQIPLTTSWQPFVFEFTAVDSTVKFRRGTANNRTIWIDTTSLVRLGAVVHLPLDDGGGFQLRDVSTNALHALMTTTGVSHVRPLSGPFRARFTSSTNGNQQLGGQVVIPANSQILRVRAKASTGTPNVTLGTSSGGTQIVASVALSTAWQTLTIALTGGQVGSSNISLWAGSNSTATIDWDVAWEPLSA